MQIRTVAALVVASMAAPAMASVTYSDGTFNTANWGFETVAVGPGGTSSASQVAGGNPGTARQIVNTINGGGGLVWGVSRFGTTNATRYEPVNQGAILTVDFAIDFRFVEGIGGEGQSVVVIAKQGMLVYGAGYAITGSTGAWGSHAVTGLTAADFTLLNGASGPAIDFSGTAVPLRFGFGAGNSAPNNTYSNTVMYDNFEVVVNNVPAPAGGVLAGLGVLCAARRRR